MKPLLGAFDSEVQVWPSYTDVALNLILMLLFFLFALIVYIGRTVPCQQAVHRSQEAMKQAVMAAVRPELRSNVTIGEDGGLQRLSFSDRILFDSGQAELKASGVEILDAIGKVFNKQVGSFSQIQIEGHTDNIPVSGRFTSNWQLSSERATSVVRFLQEKSSVDPKLLSANGYAEYQPVASNLTDDGRARNRRIAIVLVYSYKNCAPSNEKALPAAPGGKQVVLNSTERRPCLQCL